VENAKIMPKRDEAFNHSRRVRGEEPHPTRGTTVLAKHAGSRPEKVDKKSSFDEVSSLSKMKQPDAQSTTASESDCPNENDPSEPKGHN